MNFSPFPPLSWENGKWATETALPGLSPLQPVIFAVQVNGTPDQQDEQTANPPTDSQAAAYSYLLESGERIRAAMLTAMQLYVPEWQGKAGEEYASEVELTTVVILHTALDGMAYVGFEWAGMEFEHGIGIIMHQDRVVYSGMAEEAGEERLAQRDVRREKKARRTG